MTSDRADVVAALRASGGNVSVAAKRLGASRRTLQNRMRSYGLPRGRAGRRKRRLRYRGALRVAAIAAAIAGVGVAGLVLRRRARQV